MMTQTTKGYQYRTLQRCRNEIRLLRILPADNNKKLKLLPACHVFHASLDEQPDFVALSYVWGSSTTQRVILVEDSEFRVTKNLYDALMMLRPFDDELVIWIDGLCINQSDNEEKSWQVDLMADIYSKARRVVAWLGPAESEDDSVVDYMNALGEKAEACGLDNGFETHQRLWHIMALFPRERLDLVQPTAMIELEVPSGEILKVSLGALRKSFYSISGWHGQENLLPVAGMERFFTRPWWGRMWVLQEITLPENAEFFYGSKRITRRRCTAALHAFCALRLVLMNIHINKLKPLNGYHFQIIEALFQHRPEVMLSSWNIYRYSTFPLVALLRATCVGSINPNRHGAHHLAATDPRDKVFALLGLAADRKKLAKMGVFPDYSRSCEEIYTTTMVAMLRQGHMSLLSFCQSPKIQSNLPSWVPDWSRSATHMLQDVRNDHVTLYPEFSASGPLPSHSKIRVIKREGKVAGISLQCYLYDEIHEVGSFSKRISSHVVPLNETHSWPVKWLVEFMRLTYHNSQRYVEFSDRVHAAARTSIGGVCYSENTEMVRVGEEHFLDAVRLLKNNIEKIKSNRIRLGLQQLWKKVTQIDKPRMKAIRSKFGSEIIGKSLGRLPFVTGKGHLVLGPEYVKRGDFVALIKGTQVPFILRRQSDGQYQLVSEAYVDGIMDGEAIKNARWCEANLV